MPARSLSLPDLIIVVAAIAGIGGGIAGAYTALRRLYRRTIGSRRDLARRLNQVAAGVTTDYVNARFGAPAFSRAFQWPNRMNGRGKPQTRELVYREKHAWLQTVVDQNDAVLRFSITVTDPRFKFQIRDLTFGHLSARLGSSRFAGLECQWATQGRRLRIGAHNREYAEAYYCGNPGNYQTFVVSNNDAAPGEFGY